MVIDELGDIMLRPELKRKVEQRLVRIIQLGRAMGIRVVVATQTPKSSVITGLIQNNINSWLAFRCGNGIASGLMLDGKWDAARLPAIPGRGIFREGGQLTEVQTPEVTDLTVRSTVRAAKEGGAPVATAEKQRTIAPDRVFEYALAELDGFCTIDDLYRHFKKELVTRREIMDILKEYEVTGAPPALEPEIEIGADEQVFYLAPSPGGRVPRKLIPGEQFIAEFDGKWGAVLALRVPSSTKFGGQSRGDNSKTHEVIAAEEAETYEPETDFEEERIADYD
jgi:hypothetical protein